MKFNKLSTTGFTATRTRLGLSQQQLAEQLGISRTTISMAELGRRQLSAATLVKLAQLEIKMTAASAESTINPSTLRQAQCVRDYREINSNLPIQATPEFIQYREKQCDLQIQKLSAKLEMMSTQYKTLHTQRGLLDAMLEKETSDQNNMLIISLQVHRDRIIKQLSRCSPTEQQLLRNKIALLSAESHLNRSVRQQLS